MSDLNGEPEDRFIRDAAHLMLARGFVSPLLVVLLLSCVAAANQISHTCVYIVDQSYALKHKFISSQLDSILLD